MRVTERQETHGTGERVSEQAVGSWYALFLQRVGSQLCSAIAELMHNEPSSAQLLATMDIKLECVFMNCFS